MSVGPSPYNLPNRNRYGLAVKKKVFEGNYGRVAKVPFTIFIYKILYIDSKFKLLQFFFSQIIYKGGPLRLSLGYLGVAFLPLNGFISSNYDTLRLIQYRKLYNSSMQYIMNIHKRS